MNASPSETVITMPSAPPAELFARQLIRATMRPVRMLAAIAGMRGFAPKNSPTAAPRSAACITANRAGMSSRFRMNVPSAGKVMPVTTSAMIAREKTGMVKISSISNLE